MGLAISVGVLAEVSDDREGAKFERRRFKHLNKWLRRAGLPKHAEPKDLSEVLSYDGLGYTGLHCLRRFAATIWARNEWPLPLESGEQAANDPVLKQLSLTCDWSLGKNGFRMFRSPAGHGPSFDHLVFHSDCDGVYLPCVGAEVLLAPSQQKGEVEAVGSSRELERECKELARILEIPETADPEDEQLWRVSDNPASTGAPWQRYGMEAFVCLRLLRAAEQSLRTGAAIVFH